MKHEQLRFKDYVQGFNTEGFAEVGIVIGIVALLFILLQFA